METTVWLFLIIAGLVVYVFVLGLFEVYYFITLGLTAFVARFFKKRTHIMDMTTVTRTCLTNDIDTLLYHMNNSRYFRELDFARADFFERTGLYRKVLSKGGEILQGAATIRYRRYIRIFSRYKITTKIVYWDDQSIFTEHRFLSTKDNFVHCIILSRQRIIKTSAEALMREMLKASANNHLVRRSDSSSINNNNNNNNNNNAPDSNNINNNNNNNNNIENIVSSQEEEMVRAMKKNGTTTVLDDLESGWDFVKPSEPPEVAKWMEYNEISSLKLRSEIL